MTAIRFEHVYKSFPPAAPILQDVSFNVEAGQVLALQGPSGCGKTTLLRLLAGLERPDRGRIRLAGQDAARIPPHDRNIAFLFQTPVLYPQLSVEENLAVGCRLRYTMTNPWWKRTSPSSDFRQRLSEVAELLELQLLLSRQPATLSGGERQRTALGRALLRRPAVFLLDEPLAYLDQDLARRLRFRLSTWFRACAATVLWVTHLPEEADAVAQRIAVLRHGALTEITPANIAQSSTQGAS